MGAGVREGEIGDYSWTNWLIMDWRFPLFSFCRLRTRTILYLGWTDTFLSLPSYIYVSFVPTYNYLREVKSNLSAALMTAFCILVGIRYTGICYRAWYILQKLLLSYLSYTGVRGHIHTHTYKQSKYTCIVVLPLSLRFGWTVPYSQWRYVSIGGRLWGRLKNIETLDRTRQLHQSILYPSRRYRKQ